MIFFIFYHFFEFEFYCLIINSNFSSASVNASAVISWDNPFIIIQSAQILIWQNWRLSNEFLVRIGFHRSFRFHCFEFTIFYIWLYLPVLGCSLIVISFFTRKIIRFWSVTLSSSCWIGFPLTFSSLCNWVLPLC